MISCITTHSPEANGTKIPLHRSVYSIQPPSLSSLKQVTFKGKISLTSHGRISFSFPSVYSAAKGNRNLRSGTVFCGSQVSRDLWRWIMWTNLPNVWSLQIFTICTKRIYTCIFIYIYMYIYHIYTSTPKITVTSCWNGHSRKRNNVIFQQTCFKLHCLKRFLKHPP